MSSKYVETGYSSSPLTHL